MSALFVTMLLAGTPTAPAATALSQCEAFNREEEERRRNHTGPCPYCPCACGERGIVCAPCMACDPSRHRPNDDLVAPVRATHRVSGRAVLVSRICGGGAAITPERAGQLPPPQPLAGKKLLVTAGEAIATTNPVARITTSEEGKFDLRLEPGTWCVFDAARKLEAREAARSAAAAPNQDSACLVRERHRCDEVLRVGNGDRDGVQITFYASCPQPYNQPCYRGPAPP